MDKLDCIISEQFWLEQHNKWTMELMLIQRSIEAFEKSNVDFMSKGISILNLLKQLIELGVDNGTEYIASNKKLWECYKH